MGAKRTYGDACGIARALDLVGERWALMIVRELLLGPKRFTDIRTGLPHLSPDVLAQRLRELEQTGIVQHRKVPPPYAVQVYELTAGGRALEPVLVELGRWGGAYGLPPDGESWMSRDAHVLSLRTLFDPARAGDFAVRVQLRLDDCPFHVAIADGQIEVGCGEASEPDCTIAGDPGTLIDVVHGRRPLEDALAAADLRIEGDEPRARRFCELFPLPAPIEA